MNLATALLTAQRRATMWQEPRYVVAYSGIYNVVSEYQLPRFVATFLDVEIVHVINPNEDVLS